MRRDAVMVAIGILIGLAIGWWLWKPSSPVIEHHAPEVSLPSGGLALEREPEAPVPVTVKQAARELDRAAKIERAIKVTVAPKQSVTAVGHCNPIDLDIGVVKMPDDTHRVVVHSSNGDIMGGLDIPVQATESVKKLKWAAGAVYAPREEAYGAFIDRDIGPLRVGAEVVQSREYGISGMVKVGIRF